MILELKKLFAGGEPIVVDEKFTYPESELTGASEVHVFGKLESRAGVVHLNITAEFTLSLLCDRCLDPVEERYSMPLSHVLVTSLNHEDNDELILVEDYQLDLKELVLSDLLLNLPMKHLCREDCKGLCSKCGANLNQGDCGCDRKPMDPRFAALRDLLD